MKAHLVKPLTALAICLVMAVMADAQIPVYINHDMAQKKPVPFYCTGRPGTPNPIHLLKKIDPNISAKMPSQLYYNMSIPPKFVFKKKPPVKIQ